MSAGYKQVMQHGVSFPIFRRFRKEIKRSYSKGNQRENLRNELEVSIGQFHSTYSGWCVISIGCLNNINSIIIERKCSSS